MTHFLYSSLLQQEYTYKDYVIPRGDILFVSPTLNHRLPQVFKNPDVYVAPYPFLIIFY